MPASFVERTPTIAQSTDDITALVEPWLANERLELDDVEMVGSGKGRTLRILVDAPEGVDLDRLADVSNGISRLIDDLPSLQEPYQLEVSSPGLERKLRKPSHYKKSIGRLVKVKVRVDETTRTASGELTSADDDGFVVSTESGDERFTYDAVASARTVFKWQAQPKPGTKRGMAS
jgi:ribosome maturation factor RimP